MQESRLFKIIYYLLNKGHARAHELAEKFDVSVRTIYRDIDVLSGAGIPIYVKPGRNGGIYMMSDFVLDKVILSKTEKKKILAALQSLSITGNIHEDDILSKLSALFHVQIDHWFEVDFSRWGMKTKDNEKFETLKTAIIHHKGLQISYINSQGERSERKLQPLKLMYKANAWYLKAYCTQKQDLRLFKLNRILKWRLLEEAVTSFPVAEHRDILLQEYNEIRLLFPKEMAYRVYDEFEAEQITQQKNGDFMVAARMPEDNWLIGYLLSFGTQVEVIEPEYLRDLLAEQAKKIYDKNKKKS